MEQDPAGSTVLLLGVGCEIWWCYEHVAQVKWNFMLWLGGLHVPKLRQHLVPAAWHAAARVPEIGMLGPSQREELRSSWNVDLIDQSTHVD